MAILAMENEEEVDGEGEGNGLGEVEGVEELMIQNQENVLNDLEMDYEKENEVDALLPAHNFKMTQKNFSGIGKLAEMIQEDEGRGL